MEINRYTDQVYNDILVPAIAQAAKGQITVLMDGGIRSSVGICKALTMGADGYVLARPYVTAAYGGGAEGIELLTRKLQGELADTMAMCGVRSITEIDNRLIF